MRAHRRSVSLLALALLGTATLVACSDAEDEARQRLDQFLAGWAAGDLGEVPLTDPLNEEVQGGKANEDLLALSGDLAELPPELSVASLEVNDGLGTATVDVAWPLPGGATWNYQTTVRLTDQDGWRVIWAPEVVHPELVNGDQLLLRRESAPRGEILDGDGDPLVSAREVVEVGIWPKRVQDLSAEVSTLEDALDRVVPGIDLSDLPDRVEEAEPDAFVSVITLRRDDYDQIRDEIHSLPGTTFQEYERHLAPSSTFARALLGTVGPVTAEMIEDNPGAYEAGDHAGQGGLSGQYDDLLRGVTGQTVLIARDETVLETVDPVPGTDLRTTLDPAVQRAAEAAMSDESNPSALVALRISDGEVLAVANTEGADAHPVNIALTGAVAPGSTFKMVSAYRLLSTGEVSLDTQVPCPETFTVEGFDIGNAFSGDRGEISFQESVAISCNTSFAHLAPQLGDDGLAAAGADLGLGGDWDLGTETFTGSVPTGGSDFDQAQAAFGQGQTQVSPVAMAAATAAVARGAWLPPTLVADPEADPTQAATPDLTPLDEQVIADLHTAMRDVVTGGTASALSDVPGAEVHGKTGTAEAGDLTHGWFVGWQDDIAVAIFVHDGDSGSGAAVPIAEEFLRSL